MSLPVTVSIKSNHPNKRKPSTVVEYPLDYVLMASKCQSMGHTKAHGSGLRILSSINSSIAL